MPMKPKLALMVLVASAWLCLACSGGVPSTSSSGGSGAAGDPSICTTVENKLEARCGRLADAESGLQACRTGATDASCGQLYVALLQCADAEVTRRGICPGTSEKVEGCQAEATAWSSCSRPTGTGTVTSDAGPQTGTGACTAESVCSNGACRCFKGPHADEPCCEPEDTTCTASPKCNVLCKLCE